MNVHIVHLPHTFEYLLDFSLAFHNFGFKQVVLVANGFDHVQMKSLEQFANQYSFIEILDIPTKRVLSHGQALNYAFDNSKESVFCFADHDIFPIAPLLDQIQTALINHDAVCFGDRPENMNAEYKGFAASATLTKNNLPLATSFFSAFKREVINKAKKSFNVGFEQYFRRSQLPESLNNLDDVIELQEPFLIDTCKALSLVMALTNHKIKHLGAQQVCHLGGLTGAISRYVNNGSQMISNFNSPPLPSRKELVKFYEANQIRHPKVLALKRTISDYSLQLLIALKKNKTLPVFNSEDDHLNKSIEEIKLLTSAVFHKKV